MTRRSFKDNSLSSFTHR